MWSKRNTQCLLSPMQRRHQPGSNFTSFCHDSRLPDRRVLGKFPRSQHRPCLITPPRLKVPAHSDPFKRWNFRKAFLEMNPLRGCHLRTDDREIMHADGDWQTVEGVLSKDMTTVGEYLQTWKLKLTTTKTVSAAFHLNNKEAKRELKVKFNNETRPFAPSPNTSE